MKNKFVALVPFLIILALSAWAGKGLFRFEFYTTHDGNFQISRSLDAVATAAEGHLPLRWAGSLNFNCGVPIFNFFYPLLYYLVILLNPLFQDVLLTLKIINYLSFFVGTVFIYLWFRQESKDKWASLVGSILYLYAPYRFLLVYVRGSPEYIAYALLPMVLYFYSKAFGKHFKRYLFAATVSGGLLAISHNFIAMILMPFVLLYLVFKLFELGRSQSLKTAPKAKIFLISYLSIFGLGAFFIFPALMEAKYTQLNRTPSAFSEQFVPLGQMIRSRWGYYFAYAGEAKDQMSLMLGYAQWLVLGLAGLWLGYRGIKALRGRRNKLAFFLKGDRNYVWTLALFVLSFLTIFLMLRQSLFIWENFPLLQKIQFPWRLLGVAVLTISVLFVFWVTGFKGNKLLYWPILFVVALLAVAGNHSHLLPKAVLPQEIELYREYDRLYWERHVTTTSYRDDMLAPSAKDGPCVYDTPAVETDQKEQIPFSEIKRGNTYASVLLNWEKEKYQGTFILLAQSYYPGSHSIRINSVVADYEDCGGRICIDSRKLHEGDNTLDWQVHQTALQQFFNVISLGFLCFWVIFLCERSRIPRDLSRG